MAEIGQDFGDPASVRNLAQAAGVAASDLEKLGHDLKRDVEAIVPDRWGGDTASEFQQLTYRISRSMAGLGSPMERYSRNLHVAADTMELARHQLRAAVDLAAGNAPAETVQQQLDYARRLADDAKAQIQRANELLNRDAVTSAQEMSTIVEALSGVRGLRANRRSRLTPSRKAKQDREAYWRREKELQAIRRERDWLRAENLRNPEYRKRVIENIGFPPSDGMYVAHHNFPVALSGRFRAIGIDPENPLWGSWARARDHEVFTPDHLKRWRNFFDTNPQATRDQAFDLARQMAKEYGYPF